eukprot:2805725-Prymnesium_polylepis.1
MPNGLLAGFDRFFVGMPAVPSTECAKKGGAGAVARKGTCEAGEGISGGRRLGIWVCTPPPYDLRSPAANGGQVPC